MSKPRGLPIRRLGAMIEREINENTHGASALDDARRRLILALRVAAVLMLIFFLGRPLAGGWVGWALAPAPDTIFIVIDRSASMEGKAAGINSSKREEALRRVYGEFTAD